MQIIRIGDGHAEECRADVIGAKAANLARMAALGLPVPPAFVLPIELCAAIARGDPGAKQDLSEGLREGTRFLEQATGLQLGDRRRPLLVSVRSGAARSMPGMLDTVLDVGCTSDAVHGLVRMTGHPRFAWDCRRHFLESYGTVVLGLEAARFRQRVEETVASEGVADDHSLDGEALERLSERFQDAIEEEEHAPPEDAMEQLGAAAEAVYRSWSSERARTYRRLERLEDLRGTAVTIQAMVFGNRGLSSGAGVAFSRDPSTGAADPVIDVLFGAQGEDIVSGSRNPDGEQAIARSAPAIAAQLRTTLTRLEQEFRDVQDVEFTIDDGTLWILQTRSAKRTPLAALRFAVDFVNEHLITPAEALQRLDGVDITALARKRLIDVGPAIAHGTGASAGVAVGRAAFDSSNAERIAAAGDPVILVRPDTSTADVAGFATSEGIVTAVGGRTAHAALVARQLGKACVVGCSVLTVDVASRRARLADKVLNEGDWISIDGETGALYLGRAATALERPVAELEQLQQWHRETGETVRLQQFAAAGPGPG
jgi:pyruvate,orthophosphate dikinase